MTSVLAGLLLGGAVVRLAMAVRADRDGILGCVLASVCELYNMVDFQIGAAITAQKGGIVMADLAFAARPAQHFHDDISVAHEHFGRYRDRGWLPRREGQTLAPRFRRI